MWTLDSPHIIPLTEVSCTRLILSHLLPPHPRTFGYPPRPHPRARGKISFRLQAMPWFFSGSPRIPLFACGGVPTQVRELRKAISAASPERLAQLQRESSCPIGFIQDVCENKMETPPLMQRGGSRSTLVRHRGQLQRSSTGIHLDLIYILSIYVWNSSSRLQSVQRLSDLRALLFSCKRGCIVGFACRWLLQCSG